MHQRRRHGTTSPRSRGQPEARVWLVRSPSRLRCAQRAGQEFRAGCLVSKDHTAVMPSPSLWRRRRRPLAAAEPRSCRCQRPGLGFFSRCRSSPSRRFIRSARVAGACVAKQHSLVDYGRGFSQDSSRAEACFRIAWPCHRRSGSISGIYAQTPPEEAAAQQFTGNERNYHAVWQT